jgi:hypothetical protein
MVLRPRRPKGASAQPKATDGRKIIRHNPCFETRPVLRTDHNATFVDLGSRARSLLILGVRISLTPWMCAAADRAATRHAGFQAHLAKPIEPDKLVRTIFELFSCKKEG